MDIKNILEHFRMVMPNMTEQEACDMVQPVTDIVNDIYSELGEKHPSLSKTINDNRQASVELIKDNWGR